MKVYHLRVQKKLRPYTYSFIKHIQNFNENYKLFSKSENLILAVSGGVDSICLIYLVIFLRSFGYSNSIKIIFIHHQTRKGQDAEKDFVKKISKNFGLSFEPFYVELDSISDFENEARKKRYEVFNQFKDKGKVLLGHHLNDSFEWSLMQKVRSGNLAATLGIPVKNGHIRRPFLSVTKKQILRFAKENSIQFIEDPTNLENKFLRNYYRNEIIPKIEDVNAKFLKHYVSQANALAFKLGIHVKYSTEVKVIQGDKYVLLFSLGETKKIEGLSPYIQNAVALLSNKERGSLNEQVKKCEKALSNGKLGPLNLSGGVNLYLDHNALFFTGNNSEPAGDIVLGKKKEFSLEQFSQEAVQLISNPKNLDLFPFFVVNESKSLDSRNFDTSFNIKIKNFLRQESLDYYSIFKLYREWSKKRNRHKKLVLRFITHQ